ncbi:MAG: flavodoxin [Anaerolineae bacterium]|nr:flavodoxin [Anaerolineae bacterium]
MSTKWLVCYATHAGSTREVAEFIAGSLRADGNSVDFLEARNVRQVDDYDGVVLGAPLYMFRWHRDARNFLKRMRTALSRKPVHIFALGPFHNTEDEMTTVRKQLDKELAHFTWLKPAAATIFVGKYDYASLHFPYSLIPGFKQMPACDERDWEAIRAWAKTIDRQPVA